MREAIDLDITRVDALREKARTASVPVILGFNRRFDPHIAELHRRVARGDIGPLAQLTITSRDPEPRPAAYIMASGGIFRDMTIHDFDMTRFFVPDIVEVTAHGAQQFSDDIAAAEDYDAVVVTLRGARGELITIIIHGRPSTSPSFEDGRAALILADAAARSAAEGVPVDVDLNA